MNVLTQQIQMIILMTIGMMSQALAGDTWRTQHVTLKSPLEAKVGVVEGLNGDMVGITLSNNGTTNIIEAIRMPPPYDGSGQTGTILENTEVLFAMGDICSIGDSLVVPYIRDFNLRVALYNSLSQSWSKFDIPETVADNYDNAQCGTTQDGVFLLTHNLDENDSEIYKSSNGNSPYTFYGRYASMGPFDGAIREPLATSWGDRYAMTVSQLASGAIRSTSFRTDDVTPSFTHRVIETLDPPSGFTFVKEATANYFGDHFWFSYNSEEMAKLIQIPFDMPSDFNTSTLGSISNSGSQFNFQGTTILGINDLNHEPMRLVNLWGEFYEVEQIVNPFSFLTDPEYPLQTIGGPIDGCLVQTIMGNKVIKGEGYFIGPRVGSPGTDMHIRALKIDPIFNDGFESGDTLSWEVICD
ncbi:MAG: hypothetical protein ACSHWU_02425 [Marinicella sp.]